MMEYRQHPVGDGFGNHLVVCVEETNGAPVLHLCSVPSRNREAGVLIAVLENLEEGLSDDVPEM